MSRECCKWHDRMPETFEFDDEPGIDECGLAGMGTPSVCCRKCPEYQHFIDKGVQPYIVKEIMKLPPEDRP